MRVRLAKGWRRLLEQLGTLSLSVIMGAIVWLIAIDQENPLITQEYRERLTIQAHGLAAELQPTENLNAQSVTLILRAPKSSWETLKTSDIQAFVDLAGMSKGAYELPVQVQIADPEVAVREVQPAKIPLQLDDVVSKLVPVRVQISDSPAFGYDWQTPTTNPVSVTVQGPALQVNQVAAAEVQVLLRGARSQVQSFQKVNLVDQTNQTIELVDAIPQLVEVVVPIERWPGRKEVAVRVNLDGEPAPGFRLGAINIEPKTIVLRGNNDALNQVPGFVETEPLSVTNATNDLSAHLKLILPPQVTAFEEDMVDVIVKIVPLEGGLKIPLKPVLRNLNDELYQATAALDTVDVILSGPQSQLESLGPDDVFVMVDLANLTPGVHQLTPDVRKPPGLTLDSVLPATIEVVITAKEQPPAVDSTQVITDTQR